MELNKIYNGDCLKVMDELINDGVKVDAIITDIPYGTTKCKWDSIIPFDSMWERLKKIRKDTTPIVLFGAEPFSSALRMSNIKEYKYDWTWYKSRKSNHLNAKKQPLRSIELISVFYKKQCLYNPQLRDREKKDMRYSHTKISGKTGNTYNDEVEHTFAQFRTIPVEKGYPIDLIDIPTVGTFGNVRIHSCQKPVKLIEYLINTYTNKDDIVLDFTIGSGTTAIACLNTNRRYLGIEKDKQIFDMAIDRVSGYIHIN